MHFEIGSLRFDVISDGLFDLRPETFVKLTSNGTELFDKAKFRPRIKVGFNCLLIRGPERTVLIDPGTGDKERIAERRDYNLDWPRKLLPTLKELGVRREAIDLVVLTHLHWDHAGACTTVGHGGQLEPTFSKARYVAQRRELDGARAALAANDDGYCADDFEPLVDARKFDLVDTDDAQLLPWLSVHWSGGHSAGHQVARVGFEHEQGVLFLSDVLPTTAQLPLDSRMSYDQNPAELAAAKRKFMSQAARERDIVILVHAPRNRIGNLNEISSDTFQFEYLKP